MKEHHDGLNKESGDIKDIRLSIWTSELIKSKVKSPYFYSTTTHNVYIMGIVFRTLYTQRENQLVPNQRKKSKISGR